MDKQEALQDEEFDLESILNEFHDDPETAQAPLDTMPELSFSEEEDEAPSEEASSEEDQEPDLSGATVRFDPVTEEEAEPLPEETAQEAGSVVPPEELDHPAFDVEEAFIPAPSVFTPKSRLKELKKKLVAGPEKQYYALSEKGTGKLQAAILLSLLMTAIAAGIAAFSALGYVAENRIKFVVFSQVFCMLISALLGCQLMLDAIGALFTKGRFSLNTLLVITFGVCVADSVFCLQEQRVPCCGAFCLEMTMALWARYQRRNTELSELDTMRKAVRLHALVKTDDYFEGKPGIQQVEGEVEDFMDTYQTTTAPEKLQGVYAFVAMLAAMAISVLAGLTHGTSMAVQVLSTSLLAAVPATFFIASARPKAILEQRLHMVGTVLCGWKGVKALSGKAAFPLGDHDLFPQGSTKLNGVKFYGSRDPDEVVSMTTSLIATAGGGLEAVFQQLLKNRGGELQAVESFRNYGKGGIGGMVNGEPVLLGTLSFLQDMDVDIPQGTMVNQAVYAAIDGELSAVYAISYAKMRSASAGLVTLSGYRKLIPVVLCRDFMLTEEFLRSKFGLKSRRLAFPDQETREKLLKKQPSADAPVLALITREELVSAAYAVTGSRALRTSTNLGMVIHLLGGVVGLLIMLVLAILGSTELLTPTNLLLYQLVWAVPGLLVTEWARTV